ncbi:hypothetical protein CVT24_006130 [Panaeolus cyanescens]|uniref:Major facilitator superfamily (MFS) profile domain-containing protein n=1 Tax=Panaeolus cyanescens TaxID=181874 RepID=A0A409YDV0_9AGAR|nr:hypothetical protein CVT24_006130 [Panaeolus cyanescens]
MLELTNDGSDVKSESTLSEKTYEDKIEAVNVALKDIGMGRYQWILFVLTGFGYFAGNLWPVVTALILPPVMNEFPNAQGPLLKLGQNIGLLVGAVFWGLGADIWGRRLSYYINLLLTGAFGVAAGASPNFEILVVLASLWSLGVGGNMPVDAAIFLEFIPSSHQYLLTVLSIWWTFGQLVGSLIAWPLIGRLSCPASYITSHSPSLCDSSMNQGWRYFLYTMGGLMLLLWGIRIFLFRISETPKYLVGKGRESEAVEVLRRIARWNRRPDVWVEREAFGLGNSDEGLDENVRATKHQSRERWTTQLRVNHIKPLFETREKARTTSILIVIWALIGLAFPLYNSFIPYYLATRGATFGDGSMSMTYRNQVILSVISIPASLLAGYMVSLPILGRRGTLAIFTILTGVFILLSATSQSSNALLGWNCAYTFTNNVMYGVLYAMTPELFDTKDRGTANAITAGANRIFGIMAPIIALYADLTTSVPIFIAGAIFICAVGVFAVSAGASPNFEVLTSMVALWSLGVGGNLPVDTAIFLEFVPSTHQHLLTVLSIWWAVGQLIGSLVAWPLIGNFSCPSRSSTPSSPYTCPESQNRGWRYFLYSMGGLMLLLWALRFFVFKLYETPKYLVGKGRDREAGEVLEKVRKFNGVRGHDLNLEGTFQKDGNIELKQDTDDGTGDSLGKTGGSLVGAGKAWWNLIQNELRANHVRPLFETKEKAVTVSLLIAIWALIGLAFPLYNAFVTYYLATRGAKFGDGSVYITYRNQVILSSIGVPASLLAGYMVSLPLLGRRGTLSLFTLLTGTFILLSTTSRSSNALLGWNCAYTFTSNVMYGVLYAMTPELFESKNRGTANALTAGANRIFGIMAPIIALYADLTTSVPIFIAGAIFIGAGLLPLLIPIETRDQQAK